ASRSWSSTSAPSPLRWAWPSGVTRSSLAVAWPPLGGIWLVPVSLGLAMSSSCGVGGDRNYPATHEEDALRLHLCSTALIGKGPAEAGPFQDQPDASRSASRRRLGHALRQRAARGTAEALRQQPLQRLCF